MTYIVAIFFNILPTLKMLFAFWDKFGSHHPEQVLKISNMFKGNICGGVTEAATVDILYKKGVLKNLAKFAGKHLRQSLLFNKVAGLRPFYRTPLNNCFCS